MLIIKSFELFKKLMADLKDDNNLKILGNITEKPSTIRVLNESPQKNVKLEICLYISSSALTFAYNDVINLKDEEKVNSVKTFLNRLNIIKANAIIKNNNIELS